MLKIKKFQTKAFTLIESLLVLGICSFLVLSFSSSFKGVMTQVEENLFFLSFEHFYRDSQNVSALRRAPITVTLSDRTISNGEKNLKLPPSVSLDKTQTLVFQNGGGNSTLQKVQFTASQTKVSYQLYIGSGKYKKTVY